MGKRLEEDLREDSTNPAIKRAFSLVRSRLFQIKRFVEEGHNAEYIRRKVFGESIGYARFLGIYKIITGEGLKQPKKPLKGFEEDRYSYSVDSFLSSLVGQDDIARIRNGDTPAAIRRCY